MKEKSGPITLSAMKESFNKMGFPMSVYSDNDSAFQAGVKDFFEKEGITHVVTLTHANVVERFIRTMKNMIHDRVRFNRGVGLLCCPKHWINTTTPSIHPRK